MSDLSLRVYGVLRKEVVELLRQPGLLLILVIGPLAILLLFGAGIRPVDPALRVSFVVPADNEQVRDLVEDFASEQEERLLVQQITSDRDGTEQALRADHIQVMIEVPDVQVDDVTDGERPTLLVRHNFLDPLEAQAIRLLTDRAVADINDRIVQSVVAEVQQTARDVSDRIEEGQDTGEVTVSEDGRAQIERARELAALDPALLVTPLDGDAETEGGAISTSQFYAPAVVALIVQHLTITFVALSISRERSQRTVELLAVSPLRPVERLVGKVLAYLLIGLVLGAAMLAAVVLILGAPLRGGVGSVALVVALELLASIGVGFVLAAISRTTTQVVQGAMLILLLSVFFGGLLLSPERLLEWARPVGLILPMNHAIGGLRDSMLRGVTVDVVPLVSLVAITIVTFTVGAVQITRQQRMT